MKTVVECELREHTVPCKVCGHIPPDYCGEVIVGAPVEDFLEAEGTDTEETTEEAASEVPKARRKRAVTA